MTESNLAFTEQTLKATCPITGFEMISRPEWKNQTFGSNSFKISYFVIDSRILMLRMEGIISLDIARNIIRQRDEIVKEYFAIEADYVEIDDLTDLFKISTKARRFFTKSQRKNLRLKGIVYFGVKKRFLLIMKIVKAFSKFKFPLILVKDYSEAINSSQMLLLENGRIKELEKFKEKTSEVVKFEWQNIEIGENYFASFSVVNGNFFHVKINGTPTAEDMENYLKTHDRVLKEAGLWRKKYVEIKDYSFVRKVPSSKVRNIFAKGLSKEVARGYLKAFIGYNGPIQLRIFTNVGSKLYMAKVPVKIVSNYGAAIKLAGKILNRGSRKARNAEKIQLRKVRDKKIFLKSDIDRYSKEIIDILGAINWEKDGLSVEDLDDNNPFKSVFDVISIIKMDFDELIMEKKEANEELEDLVLERTEELSEINKSLRKKIFEKDIIEAALKDSQSKLIKAKERAEEANKLKSRFLANVSHELRTPLNAIIGFSEIIERSDSVDDMHKKGSLVLRESEILLALISEILDEAKIQSGKMELAKTDVNIRELIRESLSNFEASTQKTTVELISEVASDVPTYIAADPLRLRQIFMNLIGNSIKFTSEGHIKVICEKRGCTGTECIVKFTVEDTGIGIPESQQGKIFESFVQVDNTTSRNYGGTGLGTSISKQLVELMGGKINIKSIENEGTRIWFEIKTVVSDTSSITPKSSSSSDEHLKFKKANILIAEDYVANQEVARNHLESAGHEVAIVYNGKEAVEACKHKTFDMVLMDIQMAVMDGLDATRRIRSLVNNKMSSVKIVAMTANSDEKTKRLCAEAGMNGFISKPIRRQKLLKTVSQVMCDEIAFNFNDVVEESESTFVSEDPIMINEALEEYGGDKNLFETVLNAFITQLEQQLPILHEAVSSADYDTIEREAHKIRGGASNVMANKLTVLATKLEDKAGEKDKNALKGVFELFEEEYSVLKSFLKI